MTCFRMKTGETLRSYCKKEKLKYECIKYYCDTHGMMPDDAVEYVKYREKNGIRKTKHFVNGKSFYNWCMVNNFTYQTIYNNAVRHKVTPEEEALYMIKKGKAK